MPHVQRCNTRCILFKRCHIHVAACRLYSLWFLVCFGVLCTIFAASPHLKFHFLYAYVSLRICLQQFHGCGTLLVFRSLYLFVRLFFLWKFHIKGSNFCGALVFYVIPHYFDRQQSLRGHIASCGFLWHTQPI